MTDPDTLPAGPELDRLVAERVMGWKPKTSGLSYVRYDSERVVGASTWHAGSERIDFAPSRDIAHAWEVVEKLRAAGHEILVNSWHGRPALGNYCALVTMPDGHDTGQQVADTAPLAICRAALKAVR